MVTLIIRDFFNLVTVEGEFTCHSYSEGGAAWVTICTSSKRRIMIELPSDNIKWASEGKHTALEMYFDVFLKFMAKILDKIQQSLEQDE